MGRHRSSWAVVRTHVFSVAVVAMATASCTTIHSNSARQFADGVGTVRTQSALAFTSLNELTTETIVDYAASQKTLNEQNLFTVLPPQSVAQWDTALGIMEDYGTALAQLTSPDVTTATNDALV